MYKLADFGVAHMLDEENKTRLRSTEGTYHFLAPECTTGNEYDPFQVDIWALGVTLYAMLQGSLPFGAEAASLTQVMDSIREDPLVFGPETEADCVDVMKLMLEKDPNKRIRIQELKVHPWILEGSELVRLNRANSVVVEVTQQEIEAAFTPVNNFILMTKLKMKMSSRLARARKSVELRHDLDLVELRARSMFATPALHHDHNNAGIQEAEVECNTPRPPMEIPLVVQSDVGSHGPAAQVLHDRVDVKRRNSILLKVMPDELDSLLSATASVPLSPTNSEALPRFHAGHHSEVGPTLEDAGAPARNLTQTLKSAHSPPSSLSHRTSRRVSVNPGAEPRLPPLELSFSPSSSPAQSPAASPTNRERISGSGSFEALDTSNHLWTSDGHDASPISRPSLERRRSSTSEKGNVLPTSEPPVMLQHRKSGSLSMQPSEDTYAQALAEAKRKSSLAQRSHSSNPSRTTRDTSPAAPGVSASLDSSPVVRQSQSDSGTVALAGTRSSWSSNGTGSVLIPLILAPRSPSRTTVQTESLVLNTTPEDSPQTTGRDGPVGQMIRMSSIAKALGDCIWTEQHTGTITTASIPKNRDEDTSISELGSCSSARSELSVSERSPPKLFQKRNSNITPVNDASDTSNAFSQAIIGGSSPSKRFEPPSPTNASAIDEHEQQQQWENPSFVNLEHKDGVGSPNKPRRGTFIRVFSKRKSLLEAQDSMQMLLRRKTSMKKLAINDSRGSEAYESRLEDTVENTIANVVANAGDSPKKRRSIRIGPTMSALTRASSQQAVQELAKPVAKLRSQKTVACCVM